jgi:peptidoglycan/LPS O-acetylase OafA/YrhL
MAVLFAVAILSLMVRHRERVPVDLTARQVATHLLFVHGLWTDTIYGISTPFWSLSTEFQFYLTLPLLYALSRRVGFWPTIAAVLVLSLAWRAILASALPGAGHLINGLFLGRWTEFAVGMGIAFWYGGNEPGWVGRVPGPVLAMAAAALFGAACAATYYRYLFISDYVYCAGYATLLVATLLSVRRGGRLRRAAEYAPLAWVGAVSYTLYLIHPCVIERGIQVYRLLVPHPDLISDAIAVVALLSMVLTSGWAFYWLVERHFVRSVDSPRGVSPIGAPALSLKTASPVAPS